MAQTSERLLLNLPTVSVLIPTLNSDRTVDSCLASIVEQDYPSELVEIIVADGGSDDRTREVAEGYGAEVIVNRLRTGETGKMAALRHARHDLVALVDSDNILPRPDWLKKMVAPLVMDEKIVGSEPWEFTRRDGDPPFTRYCAMLGMNDPICHFIGNYDRMNLLTETWTSLPVNAEDGEDFVIIDPEPGVLPTIGANGTVWRRDALNIWKDRDYLFDIDVLESLVEDGQHRFAKVKIGIIHLYADGLRQFSVKQTRRVSDYLYFRASGRRSYPWTAERRMGILRFVIACVTVAPLLRDTLVGYRRSRDLAWLLHAPSCWVTLAIYTWGFLASRARRLPQSRKRWHA